MMNFLSGYKTYIGAGLKAMAAFIRIVWPEIEDLAKIIDDLGNFFLAIGIGHKLAKVAK